MKIIGLPVVYVASILLFIFVILVIRVLVKAAGASESSRYFSKRPLSEIEQNMYWKLSKAYEGEKIILSQVAFSSFIGATGTGKNRNSKFYKARQKVADFVICNKDFSVHAIVEVDDKTHNVLKDAARDLITEEAGIRTFRVEAKALPSIEELKAAIQ